MRVRAFGPFLGMWMLGLAVWAAPLGAQSPSKPLSPTQIARLLTKCTVTLRTPQTSGQKDPAQVEVFSGVGVGKGLVVSFYDPPDQRPLRVTVVGGKQAQATVEVWDQYSGLCLLRVQGAEVHGVKLASADPEPGERIFSAAASGMERPVISMGIVGGVDRVLSGAELPPLLQCDLRTCETSTGAAVVNQHGQLVGIVAVAEGPPEGWAWAVPVSHVRRLLRARVPGKKVILPRRRPVLGCVMQRGPQPGEVFIQRLAPGGPAQKAGLQPGDRILAADGLQVRSVYQVVSLVLKKQPGDQITLTVLRDGKALRVPVVLGGAQVFQGEQWNRALRLAPRRLQISITGRQVYEIHTRPQVQASQHQLPPEARLFAEQARRFAALIETLRRQLRQREEQIRQQEQKIQALERQIQQLQQQLKQLSSGK